MPSANSSASSKFPSKRQVRILRKASTPTAAMRGGKRGLSPRPRIAVEQVERRCVEVQPHRFALANSGAMLRPHLDPVFADFDVADAAVAQVLDQVDAAGDTVGGEGQRAGTKTDDNGAIADAVALQSGFELADDQPSVIDRARGSRRSCRRSAA